MGQLGLGLRLGVEDEEIVGPVTVGDVGQPRPVGGPRRPLVVGEGDGLAVEQQALPPALPRVDRQRVRFAACDENAISRRSCDNAGRLSQVDPPAVVSWVPRVGSSSDSTGRGTRPGASRPDRGGSGSSRPSASVRRPRGTQPVRSATSSSRRRARTGRVRRCRTVRCPRSSMFAGSDDVAADTAVVVGVADGSSDDRSAASEDAAGAEHEGPMPTIDPAPLGPSSSWSR